jgi:hypothetical protein
MKKKGSGTEVDGTSFAFGSGEAPRVALSRLRTRSDARHDIQDIRFASQTPLTQK